MSVFLGWSAGLADQRKDLVVWSRTSRLDRLVSRVDRVICRSRLNMCLVSNELPVDSTTLCLEGAGGTCGQISLGLE